MKKWLKIAIILLVIVIAVITSYFVLQGKNDTINSNYSNIQILEKNATFGENVELEKDNLKLEISNVEFDKDNKTFHVTLDFSSVDNKGLSSYMVYDFVIYDADKNIIGTNIPAGLNEIKKNFAEEFAAEHYNDKSYKSFSEHMLGTGTIIPNIVDSGKVSQTIEVGNVDTKINLETLTVRLTNIQYKNLNETEVITIDNDFMVTYK